MLKMTQKNVSRHENKAKWNAIENSYHNGKKLKWLENRKLGQITKNCKILILWHKKD